MSRIHPVLSLLLVAACSAACGRSPAVAPEPSPPSPPAHPSLTHLPLPERLATEARTRPAAPVRAEDLRRAVEAAGIPLPHWRQVLAGTIGARYCMVGQTTAGLALALCEFSDADSAARGLDYSRATFDRLIPGRQLRRKGSVVLTVTTAPEPAIAAEASRVTEIFAAL